MTDTTFRQPEEGNAMTYIQPIPHVQQLPAERVGLRARFRARLARPTRADLTARNEWQAGEITSLRARIDQLVETTRQAVTYAQAGDDAYNRLLAETQQFDLEHGRRGSELAQLRGENTALKAAHLRACDDRDAEKARADRLATAAGLVSTTVDGEVIAVDTHPAAPTPTFARLARRHPIGEADPSWSTTGWNRHQVTAAVAEGERRRTA